MYVERTEDLADGVHLDLDAKGRELGLEFLSLAAFENFVRERYLPENPVKWLRFEADLRRILLGSSS